MALTVPEVPGVHAMPVMIAVLCILAIAYRYYSAFLAARVATLDDSRVTPAIRFNDGQNYHPTSKWVLFGHHFAAISGAGPLIGPVLAAQFGYLPGLLWIVIGVCLAGAVQDFLVLAASIRRDGKSLAQIAFLEIGKIAGSSAMLAIVVIIVIALAGLGKVVVNALAGDRVGFPPNSALMVPENQLAVSHSSEGATLYHVSSGSNLVWSSGQLWINEPFDLVVRSQIKPQTSFLVDKSRVENGDLTGRHRDGSPAVFWPLPPGSVRLVPGSSWGVFTIACTIPIALFVGLYMYRLRKGHVVEASIIGGALTLGATVLGGYVASHSIGSYFNLSAPAVIWAMAIYGVVAAVLPVWLLLAPRDYLSSFLKIGTIALLVIGTIVANPRLQAPAFNAKFAFGGGPVVAGKIFPFLFITIMCGAISGFHALVSSGTTPKMISRERDARTIGYGAMLMEGLVGVVAMIAAASLPPGDYYAMNMKLEDAPGYHDRLVEIGAGVEHLNVWEERTQESLHGRTGGAVTLAVGMAHIFDVALGRFSAGGEKLWKYWYHFAIMFEALFILTTIDAGTRIGRFLLQEVAGKIHPALGRQDWWPGTLASTGLIVAGWAYLINFNNFATIWGMFGIANQMLAVIALAVVSVVLINEGKVRYIWVTLLPMAFVMSTTTTAAGYLLQKDVVTWQTQWAKPAADLTRFVGLFNAGLQGGLTLLMLICTAIVVFAGIGRAWRVLVAQVPRGFEVISQGATK